MTTFFGDKYRRRRHSISKEISIRESDLYKDDPPPSLFYGTGKGFILQRPLSTLENHSTFSKTHAKLMQSLM